MLHGRLKIFSRLGGPLMLILLDYLSDTNHCPLVAITRPISWRALSWLFQTFRP
ncbi:uncharacterized protein EI90DRAFT_3029972 [Cantharellus anzutake]|uniref:uncharacterized protein n=1 Tax=Cantharellus anzutake TaxID=1750568 RepID=UPI001904EF5B|nr:uncharacterized protein EI90DRAFT_3029972 [Cantharellus anzutake]KAF8342711.1 hypothetical protein EI90DRAFT_3029972 [Cantharellus anzutake]